MTERVQLLGNEGKTVIWGRFLIIPIRKRIVELLTYSKGYGYDDLKV